MIDPRVAPQQLLRVGRMFELNGDAVSAVVAYREVLVAGEERTALEARQRLEVIARRALPERR